MLCYSLRCTSRILGTATKFTFAQGHGLTYRDIEIIEKERLRKLRLGRDTSNSKWFIPNHIQENESFDYETELYCFLKRINPNLAYLPESERISSNPSSPGALLSTAMLIILSHHSSNPDDATTVLRNKLCDLGQRELAAYLAQYFIKIYPKVGTDILHKLSSPLYCLSPKASLSLYKHLCLHDLIRKTTLGSIPLEFYNNTLGGLFLVLFLFDGQKTASQFVQTSILNYYQNIDLRDLVNFTDTNEAETKLRKYIPQAPELRVVQVDGENTGLPLHTVGVFLDTDCLAVGADYTVEAASLHALNAALTTFMFEVKNEHFLDSEFSYTLSDDFTSQENELREEVKQYLSTQFSEIEQYCTKNEIINLLQHSKSTSDLFNNKALLHIDVDDNESYKLAKKLKG